MFDNFNTGSPGRTGDSTGRNRCTDLGHRFRAPAPACLQIVAVFRRANRSASGRSSGLASCKTCSSPTTLTCKLFAALVVVVDNTTGTRLGTVSRHDSTPGNPLPHDLMAALRAFGRTQKLESPRP